MFEIEGFTHPCWILLVKNLGFEHIGRSDSIPVVVPMFQHRPASGSRGFYNSPDEEPRLRDESWSNPPEFNISMDWFKGKFTGNHRSSH